MVAARHGLPWAVVAVCVTLAPANAASPSPGEAAFAPCAGCHSVDPKQTGGTSGPNLAGVVGRKAASETGYPYSEAMVRAGAHGWVWSEGALELFLTNPQAVVPKTSMAVPGLDSAEDRLAVIAYLKAHPAP